MMGSMPRKSMASWVNMNNPKAMGSEHILRVGIEPGHGDVNSRSGYHTIDPQPCMNHSESTSNRWDKATSQQHGALAIGPAEIHHYATKYLIGNDVLAPYVARTYIHR